MIVLTRIKLILRDWKRNKLFSITAISSLTIGFVCCNLLASFVINEWKISGASPDKDKIFVLKTDNPMTLETTKEKSSWIFKQIPSLFKEKYPEINDFCRLQNANESSFEYENFRSNEINFVLADSNIRKFFKIPVVAGDLHSTLSTPGEVAITTGLAQKVYGTTNVIGKSFSYANQKEKSVQKITTVIDNSYTSSFITFDVLLPINENSYYGGVTFLKLKDSQSSGDLVKKIDGDLDELPRFTKECKYYLQSLTNFYFDKSETQTNWGFLLNRDSLFIYIGIISAIAILFIACFNFINLYLVRLFKANTSNTIHKILGAGSRELQKRFILESFIVSVTAFISAFIIILAVLPAFNHLFDAHLSISFLMDKTVLLIYFTLIIVFTFIPVIYLVIKFNNKGYKGIINNDTGKQKTAFSNTMICIQFGFSVLLILSAVLYTKQMNFISDTANINPNLIEISSDDILCDDMLTFKTEINKLSCVEASTISKLGFINTWTSMGDDGIPMLIYKMDNDFLKVHNIVLTQGTDFLTNSETNTQQVIINETLLNKYKIEDPIGKKISLQGKDFTIVGVVKDFYTEPFTVKVKPSMIQHYDDKEKEYTPLLQVKLKKSNKKAALADIEKLWKTTFPDKAFSYTFLADDFNALHSDYKRLADMIGIFTLISLLLTAFGLFAIAWHSVEQRTKEIGIRKVNGANISEILVTINKGFFKWIVIAFTFSCPLAYYIMYKWLQNFAYKTTFSWLDFAAAGLVTSGIALITVTWQSWKAATRNPVKALRNE